MILATWSASRRADETQETFQYQHTQFTNSGTIYVDSTHLLAFDYKPDGRVLENIYDNQRRVTNQLATCGSDLNLYTNAIFSYVNNFNITNAYTNYISGHTIVTDVNGNTLRYDYLNSKVTTNTDELGRIKLSKAGMPTMPRRPVIRAVLTKSGKNAVSGRNSNMIQTETSQTRFPGVI